MVAKNYNLGAVAGDVQHGRRGPRTIADGANLKVTEADGTTLTQIAIGAPAVQDDAANAKYVRERVVKTDTGFDGASVPAPATSTGEYIICATAGGAYSIGDLAYDDGVAVTRVVASEGRLVAVTDAITAFDINFDADSVYIWDDDGSVWVKIGNIGSLSGGIRQITVPVTFADDGTPVDSTAEIPANANVVSCRVDVTEVFNNTTPTISVGIAGGVSDFQATTDNDTEEVAAFVKDQDTDIGGSAEAVRVTVTAVDADQGIATITVNYVLADV